MKAGNRVKTDRRDAMMLAKLHRAGELTRIWIPDVAHAVRRAMKALPVCPTPHCRAGPRIILVMVEIRAGGVLACQWERLQAKFADQPKSAGGYPCRSEPKAWSFTIRQK